METSDSEYFESADEGLDSSDYEEDREKSKKLTGQNLGHKIIEPEVCKLKNDERTKNLQEKLQEEVVNMEISVNNNEKSQSDSEDSTLNLSLASNTCDINPLVKTSKNILTENETETHSVKLKEPVLIEYDNKEAESLITAKEFLETTLPVPKGKQSTNINSQIDLIETGTGLDLKPEKEDNLWDDDEIDWGSEAVKEESQKTEDQSPNSKNEDSGWDDFDVDWESDNRPPLKKASVTKTEHIEPQTGLLDTSKKSDLVSSAHENLWEDDDDWEPLEKPKDKPKQPEEQSGWGAWGSWDVSSLLNTATQGVSTLTNHVSQGLSTVLEGGIGIPDPEELAKINKLEKEDSRDKEPTKEDFKPVSDDSPGFGLENLVSGMSQLTKFVESTGTKVITGGLDTLEAIGKKTVEVLQEGDPGLKKKRAFLKLDTGKPNLSQILREAKEKDENENKDNQKYTEVKRTKNYEALFDDHQGLVHLEALEMLSRLCSIKLSNLNNSLTGAALKDMQETLEQVKELCELPDDEEEEKISLEEGTEIITIAVKEINIPISYNKLFSTCEESDMWLNTINLDFIDDTEMHQQAIETLAQLTAFAVEQFHKTGELLMVKDHRSTADEADSLVQITTTLKSLIIGQAGKFSDKLSSIKNANKDNISEHITNIFYEAGNSGRYIQDAFQLLIPVLQVGAV